MNTFNANVPIYLQVIDYLKLKIFSGELRPGDKIVSVRELASELSVNPNTIQRAFSELEREGLIRTERAVGRYVSDNIDLIYQCKKEYVEHCVNDFLKQMSFLKMNKEEVIRIIEEDDYEKLSNNS